MTESKPTPSIGSEASVSAIPSVPGERIAPISSPSVEDTPGIVPTGTAPSDEQHSHFAQFAHAQVREYIQLADQKAAFLFAAAAAMLAYLHGQDASHQWWAPPGQWSFSSVTAFIAMVGLAVSIALAAATVYPRIPGNPRGLLFWGAIARRETATLYVESVSRIPKESLTEVYLTHVHELALVCAAKYQSLRRAFRAAGVGFAAAVLYLLIG